MAGSGSDYVVVNIWDVTNPLSPSLEVSISNDYQYVKCYSLTTLGNMLYAGVGNFEDADHQPYPNPPGTGRFSGVMAIDLSVIASPTIESFHYTLATTPFDVLTDGTYIYVSCKDYMEVLNPAGSLSCLDYDNQSTNFRLQELVTGATSGATGVVIADNDLGAAGTLTLDRVGDTTSFINNEMLNGGRGGSNMAQADGSEYPSTDMYMARVGYYGTPNLSVGIDVVGDYAYIADAARLWIIDVSDIESPIKTSYCMLRYFDLGGPAWTGYAYDVRVIDDTAYVACGDRGLVMVDVSDKLNPKVTGFEGTSNDARGLIYVDIGGGRIIVGDATLGAGAFHVYTLGGSLVQSVTGFSKGVHKFASGPTYAGNTLYVNFINHVVYNSYDIDDPDNPTLLGTGFLSNYGRGMDAGDGLLWATCIGRWDKADTWYPNRMLPIGNEVAGTPYDIKVFGDRVFVADGYGLKVYDIAGSYIDDPNLLCQYSGPDVRALYVDESSKVCYLACYDDGLIIVQYNGSISSESPPTAAMTAPSVEGTEDATFAYSASDGSSWAWYSCNTGEPPYDYACGSVVSNLQSDSVVYNYQIINCPDDTIYDFIWTLRVRNTGGARANYASITVTIHPGTLCD